jgi:hypothetical protein
MAELERLMREAQKELAATNLENDALKALIRGEKDLREERDDEEAYALVKVNDDLRHLAN